MLERLKVEITRNRCLRYTNSKDSNAVLLQQEEHDGLRKISDQGLQPGAYSSKLLTERDLRHTSSGSKLLVLFFVLEHFYNWLHHWPQTFTCNSLKCLLVYWKGIDMHIADAFKTRTKSRLKLTKRRPYHWMNSVASELNTSLYRLRNQIENMEWFIIASIKLV